jgi:outer membrane cobalamin receptor
MLWHRAPRWVRAVVLVAACVGTLAPPGGAQQPAPTPPTFNLPEIDVAGQRPQLPTTTPAAVSVVTQDEIAASGALTVADVLRMLPELAIKSSGGPGSLTTVSIRGSSSTQVLILLDGVPLNRPDQPSVDLSSLPIQNVERVEVLRGPFSGQYGSNTLGGVINIVTKTAPETTVSGRAGSYGENVGTLSIGGKTGNLTYLLQGIWNGYSGFTSDTGYNKGTGTAKLELPTGPDSAWTLTVNKYNGTVGTPGPLPADAQDPLATTTESRTLADLTWQKGQVDGPGALFRIYTLDDGVGFNSPGTGFHSFDEADMWGAQAQVVLQASASNLFTLGAEFQGQTVAHTDSVPTPFNNTGNDLGLYLVDNWQIAPRALVTVGVRDDIYQLYGAQVDPWGGMVVLLSDRLSLRLAAGRSFRAPSFDEVAPTFNGNPNLQPEIAWQYEMGLDYALSPDLALHLGGYYTNATNLITSAPPLFVPLNVGQANITGGSIEIVGRITDRLFMRANYTDQIARDASTGLDVIYVPRQMANLEVLYSFSAKTRVDVTVGYVGDRFNDPANTQVVPGYWLTSITVNQAIGGGFGLQLGVANLFDVPYQATLDFPEPGRTFFVNLTAGF